VRPWAENFAENAFLEIMRIQEKTRDFERLKKLQ
jgi:hypothetical protein